MTDFDVAIAGGGLVGAALAASLADLPLRIALIDQHALTGMSDQRDEDGRSLALSWESRKILERLGVWTAIANEAARMDRVHVSQRGYFGVTRLRAADLRADALGYVAPYHSVAAALAERIEAQANLTVIAPASMTEIQAVPGAVELALDSEGGPSRISTRLLAGADGGQSSTRRLLGIGQQVTDYHQQALVANVRVEGGVAHEAWERFTEQGPMALLPLKNNRLALVWTGTEALTAERLAWSDGVFLEQLQGAFGYRAGEFTGVGKRVAFPLRQVLAGQLVARRAALLGNAAHSLHPVAGQGLNLALRDVRVLASLLAEGGDPGAWSLLDRYAELRGGDIRLTANATDALIRLFGQPSRLLAHARGAGLYLLDKAPLLKNRLARYGMGYRPALTSVLGT